MAITDEQMSHANSIIKWGHLVQERTDGDFTIIEYELDNSHYELHYDYKYLTWISTNPFTLGEEFTGKKKIKVLVNFIERQIFAI